MKTTPRCARLVFTCVLYSTFALLFGVERAEAQWGGTPAWTAVGSTGIVDEADTSEIAFSTTAVGFKSTAPAQAMAVVRYPVSLLPSDVTFYREGWYVFPFTRFTLTMLYERPDEGSYAAATLKRVRLADGTTSALMTVSAFDNLPAPGTQLTDKTLTCSSLCFDPSEYAYYVEVVLWKPEVANNPKVVALRVMLSF